MSAPIDISHGLPATDVLSWSDEYFLAVATTKCVYLIELRCDPSDLNNSFVFIKSSMPTPAEGLKYEVGVDRKILREGTQGNPSKILQSLQLDRTLSPHFVAGPSYNVYKTVKWSPAGCDNNGRCVLACLTRDHRLTVYRLAAKTNKLIKFAELSDLWYSHMKNAGYRHQSDTNNSYNKKDKQAVFNEYKRRCYMLAATEMHWSGIFTSSKEATESPLDPMQRLESDQECCLLAVVMKSSDVVLWRFNLPITECTSKNPSLLGVITTGLTAISSCAWNKPQTPKSTDNYSLVAIGDQEGTISLWKVDTTGMESPLSKSCLEVWTEKDHIPVQNVAWGYTTPSNSQVSKPLLVATKGIYIMVFMLDINEDNVSLIHKTHVCSNHAVSITGLCVDGNLVVTCGTDGCVQKAVISHTETGLRVDVELMEPAKPSQFRHCGMAISPGRTYVALATEVCRVGKSLDRVSKIFVKPLRSEAEVEADILNTKELLCSKLDSVEFFRQSIVANYTLPDALEVLTGDQFWKSTELKNCPFKLKLRRYLLKMKRASVQNTISQRTRGRDVEVSQEIQVLLDSTTDDIVHTENQIVLLHVQKTLKNWRDVEKDQPKSSVHPNVSSLLLMLDYILEKFSMEDEDLDKSVIAEIREKYIEHESTEGQREKCQVCSETIAFTSVNKDACSNGHQWQRCCLSLQLCQLQPTRKCQHCDAIALKPTKDQDSKWMMKLLNSRCLFCDGSLLIL